MAYGRLATWYCVLLLSVGSAAATEPRLREVIPLSGERFQAELAAIDTSGALTFHLDGQKRNMPFDELVSWGALVEPTSASTTTVTQVLLAGGGVLVADVLASDKEAIKLDSAIFGSQSVPLERLSGVMLRPPSDAQRRDRLIEKLLSAGRDADHVMLENGDELSGTILGISERAIDLDAAVGKVTLERSKIIGIAFDSALVAPAGGKGPRILLGFSDGSRLVATALVVRGNEVELTLTGGLKWRAPRESLTLVQPLAGKATYVSDLTAESYRHLPFLDTSWPYRADRNVAGTQLRSGGKLYAKGLGMHSASRLTYRLDGLYKRFEADVALDDQTGGGGSVVMRVFVDGQERYKSEVIRGGARPVPISVDVSGGKQLSLIVDFADRGDELDRANWLGARLVE